MSTNREVEGGFRTTPSERLRQEEDAMLIAAGFKPVDRASGLLWVKGDGVYYGREAALQGVKQKQREGGCLARFRPGPVALGISERTPSHTFR